MVFKAVRDRVPLSGCISGMLCIFIYFIYALAEYPVFPDPAGAGSHHLSGGGDRCDCVFYDFLPGTVRVAYI